MRFLVLIKGKMPVPPDMASALFDGMLAWIDGNTKSGKLEQAWGFAGLPAGGGILNVESFEELDSIMANAPLAPFSTVKIYGLSDVHQGLNAAKRAVETMMGRG